jgi:hypothetical protein
MEKVFPLSEIIKAELLASFQVEFFLIVHQSVLQSNFDLT